MHRRVPRSLRWLLAGVWACAIFYASSRSGATLPGGFAVQGHLIEYFVFGAILTWALSVDDPTVPAMVLAVIIASIYGVTDEYHQHFVPGRTPDVADWVLDTAGAAAGALFARAMIVRSNRKRERLESGSAN